MPKVSILLPYWNVPREWVHECLHSVWAQTYQNYETICIDNASDEPLPAEWFADYFVRSVHGHMVESIPLFLKLARGECVMNLPMNDWLEPNYLDRCVPLLDADPEAMFVAPNGSVWDDGIYDDNTMWSHSLFRREAWERWPHKRNPIDVEGAEDWRVWMLMRKAGVKGYTIPDWLVHWRQHDGISSRLNGTAQWAQLKAAYRKEAGLD